MSTPRILTAALGVFGIALTIAVPIWDRFAFEITGESDGGFVELLALSGLTLLSAATFLVLLCFRACRSRWAVWTLVAWLAIGTVVVYRFTFPNVAEPIVHEE